MVHNCTPDDVRKLAERAQSLRETEGLGPRWTQELHTPNAGSALVQFTDQGVTTTFWQDFYSSDEAGHVEPQAVSWAIRVINSVNQLMGKGLDFTVKVLTQYKPCPGGCNLMINSGVWQDWLDQVAGSPVEFQVWHDPDVGDPYFWIGRP